MPLLFPLFLFRFPFLSYPPFRDPLSFAQTPEAKSCAAMAQPTLRGSQTRSIAFSLPWTFSPPAHLKESKGSSAAEHAAASPHRFQRRTSAASVPSGVFPFLSLPFEPSPTLPPPPLHRPDRRAMAELVNHMAQFQPPLLVPKKEGLASHHPSPSAMPDDTRRVPPPPPALPELLDQALCNSDAFDFNLPPFFPVLFLSLPPVLLVKIAQIDRIAEGQFPGRRDSVLENPRLRPCVKTFIPRLLLFFLFSSPTFRPCARTHQGRQGNPRQRASKAR